MSSIKIPYHLNTSSTHSLTHHMYPHTLTLSFRKRTESWGRRHCFWKRRWDHVTLLQWVDNTHTHSHTHTLTHTHTHSYTHTLTHTHTHTHTLTHTLTHTHSHTHTHTHTVYKVRKQRKIVCNRPVYVDYGYRLGIFTVISHVRVPLLCTQCFYTSTIPVAGTILSDCVSVYTLCTNVSTLVLYQ